MKRDNNLFRIGMFFVLGLGFIYSIVLYYSISYRDYLIDKELQHQIEELQLHFDIANAQNSRDASAINFFLSHNEKVKEVFYKAQFATKKEQDVLRKKLFKLLSSKYQAMKTKGILQFHFVFPNNISFLRMHKPQKYGDDLSKIRYTFLYTNKTKKSSSGFEQGRLAHAFRNVFPLFKDGEYIGAYEISYTSEYMQTNLLRINKIHSRLLINKDIFNKNIWSRNELVLNYKTSIENKNYMSVVVHNCSKLALDSDETSLIVSNEKTIAKNMKDAKAFALYKAIDNEVTIAAFLPIKDFQGEKVLAYLVGYAKDPVIADLLDDFFTLNILLFVLLAFVAYLLYKQYTYKIFLQQEIVRTTKSLQELNSNLEENVRKKIEEQKQLLELFDEGNITLFKWKNDEKWSVEYVSENVKELTGYSKDEFLKREIVYAEIIDQENLEEVSKEVQNAITNHIKLFTHKPYKIYTKNAQVKWLHDTTIIIRDKDGNITHFLGYIIDISYMKSIELELKKLNTELIDEVQRQTAENIKKDKILQEQAKLAAMGEMVGAIAHQWRQPLNALNINIQNLDDDYAEGLIDEEFINQFIAKQTKTIQFMSKTIDDFRNFFRVDKTKKRFYVKDAIVATASIQSAQLKNSNVRLEIVGKDFEVETLESEFQQTILNLITNAKDEIIDRKIKNGIILIKLYSCGLIVVCDNAGGVKSEILDRIFEPYFTTKEQGKGSGLGLYMSKVIIEQNIGGVLRVQNHKKGAKFIIDFRAIKI